VKRAKPKKVSPRTASAVDKYIGARMREQTQNVSAGTLNPYLPKRVISAAQIELWLEEPSKTDATP